MKDIRVRFAPSPTGYVHIGGLRTALYNYLFAKKNGGKLLLRIEDTDRTRLVEGATENLINELAWAGIHFDEGVSLENGKVSEKGDRGPYIQSERKDEGIYEKYIQELLDNGHAYRCFCTKERLEHLKEEQKADGKMPKYDGLCRGISDEEAKKRIENGEEYVIRLKLPANRDIVFDDMVKGKITINTNDMDDQVLIKSDGFPTYHFAVVVDDHLMGITHIIRGDEWLSSTPKHVYLYEAFGWEEPKYIHLPTVLNKSGKKLSKRNDDASVEDFRNKGFLPQALVNYLALVGWCPDSNQEIFSLDELINEFDISRVQKSGGVFDMDKLKWVNAHYIRMLSDEDLAKYIEKPLKDANLIDDNTNKDFLVLLAQTFKESISTLNEIVEKSKFIFDEEVVFEDSALEHLNEENEKILAKAMVEELEKVDQIDNEFTRTIMKTIQQKTGLKGKNLYMPIRIMLTGEEHGPEFSNVLKLLGKEKILKRLK